MRPPRALWVPFEVGRPLGPPGDPAFQARVLRSALSLLAAPVGPVLADFPEDMPDEEQPAVLACPVRLRPRPVGTPNEALVESMRREVTQLRVWYDLGVVRRGRTTVGASTLEIEAAVALLSAVLTSEPPQSPAPELALCDAVRLSAEDVKAFYFEAVTAQPGPLPSSQQLNDWFWEETSGGRLLRILQSSLAQQPDEDLRDVWFLPAGVEEL